eukprot:Selendium_serpulae@DN4902_c0_g1_i14.p1
MARRPAAPLFLFVFVACFFILTIFNFAKTPAASDHSYGTREVDVPCCVDPHAFKFKHDFKYIPPVFDTLLFPKCPTDDSPAALCKAVARSYGKVGTSMFPVDYPIEAPRAGQWISHDPSDLGMLFEYSIYVAGSIYFGNDTAVYSSGIMGEDLKSDTETSFTATEVTRVGPFAGTGLFVGGTVAAGDGSITLTTGDEAKAGSDPSSRIVGGFTPVTRQEQLEAQATISAQVCALSQNMRKLDPNVDAFVNNNSTRIEVPCDEIAGLCIAEMSGELFNSDLDLFINNTNNYPVKINVGGTTIATERSVELAMTAGNVIALNFFEAETIQIDTNSTDASNFAIIAPVARWVDINTTIQSGTIFMGHPDSHLSINTTAIGTAEMIRTVDCPIPPPTLTLCQCLCPQKEKENLFLRKRKLTIADVAEAGFEYTDDADVKKKRITIDKNDLDRNALDRNYRILFDKDINNPLMPMSIRNST